MIGIRAERAEDITAIRAINLAAFPGPVEADLVDALRDHGKLLISLVAEENSLLVGHIAFSRTILQSHPALHGATLAPMAVVPALQRRGVGTLLVAAGLERCRSLGYQFVVLVGHPHFYQRFGFQPASRYGMSCRWDVPDDTFMALELQPACLPPDCGLVSYEEEFDNL